MQNKNIYLSLLLTISLIGSAAMAQKAGKEAAGADALSDFSSGGVAQKKTVDFPARSSLDTLELAPLPGIYETNINGPQPMAESVSINDMPSEQLLGRLTPEVFQEMAELERDTAYLKLQVQKEEMKNRLEDFRAQYRQSRLDEIQKREDVVRSRIQWWQEQEKLRQEMEKERAAAEELKNQMEEAEALKAQLEAAATARAENAPAEGEAAAPADVVSITNMYTLVGVKGTRGNLTARLKNTGTEEINTVKVGDTLNGEVVTNITPDAVVFERDGEEHTIKFSAT